MAMTLEPAKVEEEVTRGCWVQTISGPAVCCHVVMKTTLSLDMQTDEDGEQTFPNKDEPYVYYRHEAETPKGETL